MSASVESSKLRNRLFEDQLSLAESKSDEVTPSASRRISIVMECAHWNCSNADFINQMLAKRAVIGKPIGGVIYQCEIRALRFKYFKPG